MTATISAQKIDLAEVPAMTLEEQKPNAGLDGDSVGTRERVLWKSDAGSVETGVWESDAGRFHARFASYGEMIHIVSGEVVCTPDDGSDGFTLRAGDMAVFPRGWSGEWDVRAPIRKVYAIWDAQ